MPELPEVETVCRIMRRVLVGSRVAAAEFVPDSIVLGGVDPADVTAAVQGRTVDYIGRKGKFWWIGFAPEPGKASALCGHLGMSGWIRELGADTARLREHGKKPFDDEEGRPRFLKLLLTAESGGRIAFTDGRRLGRLWLADDPLTDPRIAALGPDAFEAMPSAPELETVFKKRSAPIKGVLMDQGFLSGIGNYLADEILYHSGIAPKRPASSLERAEIERLRQQTHTILAFAIEVGADSTRFPSDWLFHHRWDGKRGPTEIDGEAIIRETVAGRTTAWVPSRQR
jgi:formamidopyrimidine-DNA glycosylase